MITKEPIVISGAWGKGTKRSALGVKIASQGHDDAEFGRWMPARGIVLDSFGSGKFF